MKRLLTVLLLSLLVLAGCSTKANIMKDYPGFTKKDHHYVAKDPQNVMQDLEDKKEGLYYFGYAECPWCVALVPEMEKALTETNQTMIYINVKDPSFRDNQEIKDRFQKFDESLPESSRGGGSVPFVVAINKDGVIRTHIGTVPNHNGQTPLDENQQKFLNLRLKQLFEGITTAV